MNHDLNECKLIIASEINSVIKHDVVDKAVPLHCSAPGALQETLLRLSRSNLHKAGQVGTDFTISSSFLELRH